MNASVAEFHRAGWWRHRHLLALGLWSLLLGTSLFMNIQLLSHHALDNALSAAQANINKDVAFRKWASSHGGVYVPPNEHTPPNPYLKVPRRDVTTTDGQVLTLMNPAYMLRQLQQSFPSEYGVHSRITSLKPLNPANAPDPWERQALLAFEAGEPEAREVVKQGDQPHLRLMRPFVIEEACLKCHRSQGYRVGDIRGGISTAVSLAPYLVQQSRHALPLYLSHGGLWLLGLLGIAFVRRGEGRHEAKLQQERALLTESEAALRASTRAVQEAQHIGRIGSFVLDIASDTWTSSDVLDEIYGIGAHYPWENKDWVERILYPEDRAGVTAALARAVAGEQPFDLEFRILRQNDGQVRWIHGMARLETADGGPGRLIGTAQDITARRDAQRSLEENEQRLAYALDATGEGVWDWHLDSNEVRHNARWCQLLGLDEQYLSHSMAAFASRLHPEDQEAVMERIQFCLGGKGPFRSEYRLLHAQGHYLWVRDRGDVVERDAAGAPLRVVGSITDISAEVANARELAAYRHDLEDLVAKRTGELEASRREAETLARVKTDFLANMSHEIRTPLNAVLGFAQVGQKSSEGRKDQYYFSRILDSGDLLLGIINDILDFSKIEAGKLAVEKLPVDIRAAMERASGLVVPRAREKGLAWQLDCPDDLPAGFLCDDLRLSQILVNLLSNATKFTERGGITLAASLSGADMVFRVRDTGVGIEKDQLERLFDAFEQQDASTTRRFGGTGLGLAISRRLARLMGGDITVDSRPGEGSTFTLRLPFIPAQPPARKILPASLGPRLAGLSILVAEDNELNQAVLEELLTADRPHLEFVANGRAAVERVLAAPQGFDLILMDIQMPEMDGYEASRRILTRLPRLPIIGLTAHALAEERDKILAVGMVAHVTKPVQADVLVAAILRALGKEAAPPAATTPEKVPAQAAAGLDMAALNARYEGREVFIERLLRMVIRDHQDSPARLRAMAQAADWSQGRQLTHNLKAVSGHLAAPDILNLANEAEQAMEEERPDAAERLLTLADRLEALLTAVARHLEATGPV